MWFTQLVRNDLNYDIINIIIYFKIVNENSSKSLNRVESHEIELTKTKLSICVIVSCWNHERNRDYFFKLHSCFLFLFKNWKDILKYTIHTISKTLVLTFINAIWVITIGWELTTAAIHYTIYSISHLKITGRRVGYLNWLKWKVVSSHQNWNKKFKRVCLTPMTRWPHSRNT